VEIVRQACQMTLKRTAEILS